MYGLLLINHGLCIYLMTLFNVENEKEILNIYIFSVLIYIFVVGTLHLQPAREAQTS